MKKYIKSVVVAVAICATVASVSAQVHLFKMPLEFSFEAGFANQFRTGEHFSDVDIHAIRLAGLAGISLPYNLTVQTGAIYLNSHYQRTQQFPSAGYYYMQGFGHLIDVPLQVSYELPLFWKLKIFAYTGASLRIGLAEKRQIALVNLDQMTLDFLAQQQIYSSGVADLYVDRKELNRLGVLLNVGGGVKIDRFYIKSGYDFGITNINNLNANRLTQSGWFLAGGYTF